MQCRIGVFSADPHATQRAHLIRLQHALGLLLHQLQQRPQALTALEFRLAQQAAQAEGYGAAGLAGSGLVVTDQPLMAPCAS